MRPSLDPGAERVARSDSRVKRLDRREMGAPSNDGGNDTDHEDERDQRVGEADERRRGRAASDFLSSPRHRAADVQHPARPSGRATHQIGRVAEPLSNYE